jgi:hypothetical protein
MVRFIAISDGSCTTFDFITPQYERRVMSMQRILLSSSGTLDESGLPALCCGFPMDKDFHGGSGQAGDVKGGNGLRRGSGAAGAGARR